MLPRLTFRRLRHPAILLILGLLSPRATRAQEVVPVPVYVEAPVYVEEPLWAEPAPGSLLRATLGFRTWFSTGHSELNYAGFDHQPDVLSLLEWRRLQNPMLEFSIDSLWFERLILRTDLGVGTSGSGNLRDRDFAGHGQSSMTSESVHPVSSDNLYYVNFDVGWRLVTWQGFKRPEAYLAVDLLIGWQYWSEKYVARDGLDVFPGTRTFAPSDVIASTLRWDSLRLGVGGHWQLHERVSLAARVFYIPYTEFENNDIHYLRTDLLHDPSFIDCAHGGTGVQADVTLAWHILPRLGLEVGYRVWDIRSDEGVSFTRTPAGLYVSPLNEASTFRHGAIVGVHWRF